MSGAKAAAAIAVVGIAVAYFLLRAGDLEREQEESAQFALEAAAAQEDFEACVFGASSPKSWGPAAAEALVRDPELFARCAGILRSQVSSALLEHSRTDAIARFVQAVDAMRDLEPRWPGDLCDAAVSLRAELAALQRAAGKEATGAPETACEPTAPRLESVSAFEGDEHVVIWRAEPELVGRFEAEDGGEAYAAYRDGEWRRLPHPDLAVAGSFEPLGLLAILRGNPQRIVRRSGERWVDVGAGPEPGVMRRLRATRSGGLVAVAERLDPGQYWVLRAPSREGPLGPPLALAEPPLGAHPECDVPRLRADGAVFVACTVPKGDENELTVLSHAPGESAPSRVTVATATATGPNERPLLVSCGAGDEMWLRWGGRFAHDEEGRIFAADQGGGNWSEVGAVPPGGTVLCGGGELLWLGAGLRAVRCRAGDERRCTEPVRLGGSEALRSLDGSRLIVIDESERFGAVYDLEGDEPLRAIEHVSLAPRGGLRNLWQRGSVLYERVQERWGN